MSAPTGLHASDEVVLRLLAADRSARAGFAEVARQLRGVAARFAELERAGAA